MANCTNCGRAFTRGTILLQLQRASSHGGGAYRASGLGPRTRQHRGPFSASQVPRDARNIAVLGHLSAFAGYFIPFGNVAGPLIVWLMKREDSSFIDFHGKEALNFQISMTIYAIVSIILVLVVIGILLLIGLVLLELIAVCRSSHPGQQRTGVPVSSHDTFYQLAG